MLLLALMSIFKNTNPSYGNDKNMMNKDATLDRLWNAIQPSGQCFGAAQLEGHPAPIQRYLNHTIAQGTPLARAVRLHMHGEIKLKGWHPFSAEQVITSDGAMIWSATVRMHGLPIRGFDRLLAGHGEMQWKLFGLIPFLKASGPDITRSAAGRVAAEYSWLPSAFCLRRMNWHCPDETQAQAAMEIAGETSRIAMTLARDGRLEKLVLDRWGNPSGARLGYALFGGFVEQEACFGGYTIPIRLRIGWHPKDDHFESGGEFFRVTIDHAEFR